MSTTATNTAPRAEFGNVLSMFADLYAAASQYHQYRVTVRELSKLSNAELADLGLNSGSIKSVAKNAVYGA